VTLRALEFGVLALQRILRRGVRLHIKLRRLPTIDVVAGLAGAAIGAFGELTVVLVLVAIRAIGEL